MQHGAPHVSQPAKHAPSDQGQGQAVQGGGGQKQTLVVGRRLNADCQSHTLWL